MKGITCVMALAFGALAVLADESRPDFTATLQKQIDDAAMAGGGRVVVSPGRHGIHQIFIKNILIANTIARTRYGSYIAGFSDRSN